MHHKPKLHKREKHRFKKGLHLQHRALSLQVVSILSVKEEKCMPLIKRLQNLIFHFNFCKIHWSVLKQLFFNLVSVPDQLSSSWQSTAPTQNLNLKYKLRGFKWVVSGVAQTYSLYPTKAGVVWSRLPSGTDWSTFYVHRHGPDTSRKRSQEEALKLFPGEQSKVSTK